MSVSRRQLLDALLIWLRGSMKSEAFQTCPGYF
jgi:hypothetical protein